MVVGERRSVVIVSAGTEYSPVAGIGHDDSTIEIPR
jgi:hypothetical protein